MKTPRIRTPKFRAPKVSTPRVQTPAFLNNLYRDMRDRRLLLPALALIVALIAVPLALSRSSATPPPAPAAESGSNREAATSPAVLSEQLGVTNYRTRLDQLKSKNPFRKHFTALPKSATLDTVSSGGASLSATTITGAGSSTESLSSISTAPATTGGASSSTSTSTTPSTPDSQPSHGTPKPTTEVVQRRIDVKVGLQGDMQKRTGVKQLKMLPSSNKPVVVFLGTNEAGDRSSFLVSTDVTAVDGDGSCLTTTSSCQFLTLKEGQVESFDYAPDSGTYKLKLLAIRDVIVSKTHG
jgi:hypothetical protein